MEVRIPVYIKVTTILFGLILFFYAIIVAKDLLVLLAFSSMFSLLLVPVNTRLEKWKIPRGLAIVLSLALVFGLLWLMGFFVYSQLITLSTDMHAASDRLSDLLHENNEFFEKYLG